MTLSTAETEFVLSAFLDGGIEGVSPLPNFGDRPRPCRVRVDGIDVVLRTARYWPGIHAEARLLPALAEMGLPVPRLLAGPAYLGPEHEGPYTLLTFLDGETVGSFASRSREKAANLLAGAISRIHELSLPGEATANLPRLPLLSVLADIVDRDGPWSGDRDFDRAVAELRPRLAAVQVPLVFSTGDYQPGNFLTDGLSITGYVDFEFAAFQDPLYGLAKYALYDISPADRIPFVELFLESSGFNQADMDLRVALRSLWTLQRSQRPSHPTEYSRRLLGILERYLSG